MNPKLIGSIYLAVLLAAISLTCSRPQEQPAISENEKTGSSAFKPGSRNSAAPPETEQLGQLAGIWDAEQVTRNRDGSWSEDATKAQWRWYYILDGHAIQDDWIRLQTTDDSAQIYQPVGTNIRIYNPAEKQWHMAWIDKTYRRLATFTAVFENGNIIMTGHNARGKLIRNTFYDITKQSFNWTQEWTNDDGATWFAVAKIHCTRRQ